MGSLDEELQHERMLIKPTCILYESALVLTSSPVISQS